MKGRHADGSRTALVVLGMHRSGTSAAAGLVARLGAALPAGLMPPDDANPLGYWESSALKDLHDTLLAAAGSAWDLWTPLQLDRIDTAPFAAECRRLIDRDFGESALFVIKDPRVCRFVPFYLETLRRLSIDAAAILTTRDPFEVARSLQARDGLPIEHGLLLWCRHVLDAEFHTRGVRRSWVPYERLLQDWREMAAKISSDLGLTWPAARADAAEITAFVRPELRHHGAGRGAAAVSRPLADWVERAAAALDALASADGDPPAGAQAALDEVRREFDAACATFDPVVDAMSTRHQRQMAVLADEQSRLRQLGVDLAAAQETLAARVSALEEEADRLRTRAGVAERQVERLTRALEETERHLEASERAVRALHDSRTWRWSAPLRGACDLLLHLNARLFRNRPTPTDSRRQDRTSHPADPRR